VIPELERWHVLAIVGVGELTPGFGHRNPKVAAEYAYMKQYSPYDNVAAKKYPAMLVKTSFHDSQVMYWEPAKWVARLRALKTDKNPLVLKVNMAAGHGGSSGRYDKLRESAFDAAFILGQMGITR